MLKKKARPRPGATDWMSTPASRRRGPSGRRLWTSSLTRGVTPTGVLGSSSKRRCEWPPYRHSVLMSAAAEQPSLRAEPGKQPDDPLTPDALAEATAAPPAGRPGRNVVRARRGARRRRRSRRAQGGGPCACCPTGSGKSALFNRLAGAELSPTGVRRPMTSRAQVCVWDEAEVEVALTGLGGAVDQVTRITHQSPKEAALRGMVLLDLPD